MSWAAGIQFLVTVIINREYEAIARNKITEAVLRPEEQQILHYLQKIHDNRRTYGSLPSIEEVQEAFPSMNLHEVPEHPDVDYLGHVIHQEALSAKLRKETITLANLANTDPYAALDRIQHLSYELSQQHEREQSDSILTNMASEVSANLMQVIESGGLLGAPWPWEPMNMVTQGVKRGDFILFYGRPKSAKTHLTLLSAVHMYMRGYRVMWVNIEMTRVQIATRAASAICQFNYGQVLRSPTRDMVAEIQDELSSLGFVDEQTGSIHNRSVPKRFIICDADTVEAVRAKAMMIKPDIIYIDTANELRSEVKVSKKEHEVDKYVVRMLRGITREKSLGNVPIICSAHANRQGDKEVASGYGDIGGTDQWGKSCDLVLRVVRLFDPITQAWTVAVLPPVSGGREIVWDGMLINLNPYQDMGYVRDTTKEEIMELLHPDKKAGRTDNEEEPVRSGPRRRRGLSRAVQEVSLEDAAWATDVPEME